MKARGWARSFCATSSARGCWCIWWMCRTRSGRPDPVKDVKVISGELESFGAKLEEKPMIMVASKIDVANKDKLAKLKRYCKKQGLELFRISAVTGKGIEELKYAMAEQSGRDRRFTQRSFRTGGKRRGAKSKASVRRKTAAHSLEDWPMRAASVSRPLTRARHAPSRAGSGIAGFSRPRWSIEWAFCPAPACGPPRRGKPLRPPTIPQSPRGSTRLISSCALGESSSSAWKNNPERLMFSVVPSRQSCSPSGRYFNGR